MNLQLFKSAEYVCNTDCISCISNCNKHLALSKLFPSLSKYFPTSKISSNPVFVTDNALLLVAPSYKVASLLA